MDYSKMNPSGWQLQLLKTSSVLPVVLLFCLPVYGQPSNDECVNATVVTSIPFTDIVDTTTATSNPADP